MALFFSLSLSHASSFSCLPVVLSARQNVGEAEPRWPKAGHVETVLPLSRNRVADGDTQPSMAALFFHVVTFLPLLFPPSFFSSVVIFRRGSYF